MEYKFVAEKRYMADRDVVLRNVETGTVEVCFDYSGKFEFMEVGKHYNCKIALFGWEKRKNIGEWREFEVVDKNVKIGESTYIKLKFIEDVYYVYRDSIERHVDNSKLAYEYSRKDLIEVDGVVEDV